MVAPTTMRGPVRGRASRTQERPRASELNLTTRDRVGTEKTVSIAFELSSNTMVTLAIYNDEGQLVDVPFEGWLWPGKHQVECCMKGHTPGRYKCLLDTPTVRLVKYVDFLFL